MPKFEVDTQVYIFFQGYCLCLIEVERVSLIIDFVSLSGVRFDFLFVDDYFVGLSAGGAEAVVVLGRACASPGRGDSYPGSPTSLCRASGRRRISLDWR